MKVMEYFADYYRPKRYDLNLTVSRREEFLRGTVRINGCLVSNDVKTLKFHAENLQIKAVAYRLVSQTDEKSFEECDFLHQESVLEISVTEHMREKGVDLEFFIEFSGKLNHNMQGCYLSSYQWQDQEQKIIATQFESCLARQAFPCIDEPAAKAVFNLTLVVLDLEERDIVLSNMPIERQEQNRFRFVSTPPMSTYLLAWVIGPFQKVSTINTDGVRVSSYCALNQSIEALKFANQTGGRALEYYQKRFGVAYPLPKLDQVALPDFEVGAMENWGLVAFRESCMLAESDAALDSKKSVAVTVTHEIAHQWFGDLVTLKWWDDLWLNESFATIMEYSATDAIYPEFNIWTDFFTSDCVAALERDALPGVQAVYQPVHHPGEIETLFDSAIVYAKGARLILMLMRLIGEEAFDQGLHDYFEEFQYHNTVGDDLWASLQTHARFDVRGFMQAWISQPGYPALQHCNNTKEPWSQQRLLIDGSTDDSKWPLPKVQDDMSGHYLINLSEEDFQHKIAHFDELLEEQKLRLLIDRMLLAKAGVVSTVPLLDLLRKFSAEKNAGVWQIMASIIADLKIFCPPKSTIKRDFQKYLRQLLAKQILCFDHGPKELTADEIDLRNTVTSIALYATDRRTLELLSQLYQSDFTKIEPERRLFILSAKMRQAEDEVFDEFLSQYQKVEDPDLKSDLLCALSRAEAPEHCQHLLALLDSPRIVRPQDHIFLFIYLLRNPQTKLAALSWLPEHWAKIEEMTGQKTAEDYLRYGAGVITDEAEERRFFKFFDQKASEPMYARAVELAHVAVATRLARIKKYQATFAEKLTELTREGQG